MRLTVAGKAIVGVVLISQVCFGQITSFPYVENFDTIADSTLPKGWETSTNRRPSGDFFASRSIPRSAPHCLYSQNSLVPQTLTTPLIDFSNRTPDRLQFYSARSSTHKSAIVVEASIDGGNSFTVPLGDTLRNPGTNSYVLSVLSLPTMLAHRNNVRLRWRVLGDSGGSTATLRIDDVTLTTLVANDLAATALSISPHFPTSSDSLVLRATLKNLAIQTATNYAVNFFCDLNSNSILETSEKFASVYVPAISPGDSAIVIAGHSKLRAGDYRFYAIASNAFDEQHSNDTASTAVAVGYPSGSILVNEFMYAPTGDEPEWIEFLNCSSDTVNLRNWRISDFNTGSKSIITSAPLLVPPSGFCIVAKEASFSTYHPSVTCPIVVTSFSALNNTTPDAIVLYDQRLATMDSLHYSPDWGGQGGKSLERIDPEQPSLDRENWGTSQNVAGSTPGKPNSIVKLDYDLCAVRCYVTRVESGDSLVPVIHLVVLNAGKKPATSFTIRLFIDVNHDSTFAEEELIAEAPSTSPLGRGDSIVFDYRWETPPQGEASVFGVIKFLQDERPSNNCSSTLLETSYRSRTVVVNEIMYEPLEGQNEWIELYNRGTDAVDLKNWRIVDRPTATGEVNSFIISTRPLFLHSAEYCLVAADSTIFSLFPQLSNPHSGYCIVILGRSGGLSLGNDGDDIVLKDLTGKSIDSVSYSPRWHRPDVTDTKGRSLEKINPELDSNSPLNWTTSVVPAGGTPGKSNSTFTAGSQTTAALTFSPNPFSPDGDGFEDFCLIQYRLPLATASIHIKIFDIKGRLIRVLANSQISASQGEIVWDGLDQDRQRARIGPYIVLLQATTPSGGAATTLKGVVVVATRL